MIITIKNLGPIKNFEINLEKDIHFIYGKNSVGKSYIVYGIYNLLINLLNVNKEINLNRIFFSIDNNFVNLSNVFGINFKSIISTLEEKKDHKINFKKESTKIFNQIINDYLISDIKNSFGISFDSRLINNAFTKDTFSIKLKFDEYELVISKEFEKDFKIDVKIDSNIFIIRDTMHNQVTLQTDFSYGVHFSSSEVNKLDEQNIKKFVDKSFSALVSDFFIKFNNRVGGLFFLPASCSGIIQGLSSISPIIAELSKNRQNLNSKIELPTLSQPISDFYLQFTGAKVERSKKLNKLASEIEKNILKGKIIFDEVRKKIIFKQEGTNIDLELSHTSSMINEIAPFVTFLKYIMITNDEMISNRKQTDKHEVNILKNKFSILFIEEPEAHLHPEIQDKLVNYFIELTKHKIKVIITSHSNYMFNKLSNIILDKRISFKKVSVSHIVMTKTGSIDKKDMEVTEDGIDDNNFYHVAEMQYNERANIIERLNKKASNGSKNKKR